MLHTDAVKQPDHTQSRLSDARSRLREAALTHGCRLDALETFPHESEHDLFHTAFVPGRGELFFKTHLGLPQELRNWAEPASARWAERAGCGARVYPTQVEGVLVTARLPGRSLTREEGNDPSYIRQVASSLRQLHGAEPRQPARPVGCMTAGALGRIGNALRAGEVSQALHDGILRKAEWIDAQFSAIVVEPQRRFGDCHFGNWVVVDGQLYAVDLADSVYGDPYADLARYAFCQRFDDAQLQALLDLYTVQDAEPPSQDQRRRLRLHAMAQNLEYFGYFASLHGGTAPATKGLAERLKADEALEPTCPRVDLSAVLSS